MSAGRYVVVSADHDNKTILDGPLLWDPVNDYDPGEGRQLVPEADALANGWVYPPLPDWWV